jgi:aryl-alcohol dehydrogenase-like predicted oxidoreductase
VGSALDAIPPRWQAGAEAAGDLPRPWHKFGGTAPLERSREIVRRAFELGITHFDLANNYP